MSNAAAVDLQVLLKQSVSVQQYNGWQQRSKSVNLMYSPELWTLRLDR